MIKKDIEVFISTSDGRIVKRDIIRNKPYRIDIDRLKTGIFFIEIIKQNALSPHLRTTAKRQNI